jgi:hypothetical protein
MAETGAVDETLEGELTSMHLLALILELNGVKESEADRKLQVGFDQVRDWRVELQRDGLIEVDEELTDPQMRITKAGMKRLKEIENQWIAQEGVETKQKAAGFGLAIRGLRLRMRAISKKEKTDLRGIQMDVLIVLSSMFSIYLLVMFFKNPDVEAFSFLLGSAMLSIAIILYQQYSKTLRAKEFFGFATWVFQQVVNYRDYLLMLFVLVLMVYDVGMFVLKRFALSTFILFAVIIASTGYLIFFPKRTLTGVVKFYLGMFLLALGLVLVLNILSLTEYVFGEAIRWLDFVFGIGFIFLAHLNERELGLASIGRQRKA